MDEYTIRTHDSLLTLDELDEWLALTHWYNPARDPRMDGFGSGEDPVISEAF